MTENAPEQPGKHAAPDDDPNSDPPPAAGEGGEHAAPEPAEGSGEGSGDAEPEHQQPGAGSQTPQPGADPQDAAEIEAERQRRLDPDNRPEGAEVNNSEREFDATKGMFTDSEGYQEAEVQFPEPASDPPEPEPETADDAGQS